MCNKYSKQRKRLVVWTGRVMCVCVWGGDVSRLFSIWGDCESKTILLSIGQYTNRVSWTDPAMGQSLLCFPFAPSHDLSNVYMNVNGQRIHFQQGSKSRRTSNLTGSQLAILSNCVPRGWTWLTQVWTSIGSKNVKVLDREWMTEPDPNVIIVQK